jgi:hypothetical protein
LLARTWLTDLHYEQESTDGVVELKEIVGGSKIVEAALSFIYTAAYPSAPAQDVFSFHVKLYIFADRHGIIDLAQEAMRQYRQFAEARSILLPAHVKDFSMAIELVETSCPPENAMRLDSLKLATRCAKHLFSASEDAQLFQTILTDLPLFSVELCKMLALGSETAAPAPQPNTTLATFQAYGKPSSLFAPLPSSASNTAPPTLGALPGPGRATGSGTSAFGR